MTTPSETYRRDAVLAMPREQLLMKIYDALLLRIQEGEEAIASGERARAGKAISRAFDIVTALRDALDPQAGAECTPRLDQLYRTVSAWLLEANLKQSGALLRSSSRILGTLKEGWHGAIRAAS
jgi:flagellar biosynthetic protein FliS